MIILKYNPKLGDLSQGMQLTIQELSRSLDFIH
jgi:hypothetical protein